jgi:hypothetical protein
VEFFGIENEGHQVVYTLQINGLGWVVFLEVSLLWSHLIKKMSRLFILDASLALANRPVL